MTESVSYKAYLKRDGQEVEVRRFGIDAGAASNYAYLRGKIQAMFPSIHNDQFTVYWQDIDKDYITIGSDEELLEALAAFTVQPFKLYIQVKSQQQQQQQGPSGQQLHAGVTCDGCEGAISGFRYKCVTCPDFDLCSTCEAAGLHPEHFMLRITTPISGFQCHPKVFRKFFGRPHKFHKRHGWSRMAEMMHGESQGPSVASRCPFSKREGPAAGVPDMFDFSALMEFINSLGVPAAGEGERHEATVSTQATSSSTASTQATSSSQAQQTQTTSPQQPNQNTNQSQTGPQPTEYLTGIGQAIAAFLDPFGVDVTFDVRPKPTGAQEPATPSTLPQQNTPATPVPQSTSTTPQNPPVLEVRVPAPSTVTPTEATLPAAPEVPTTQTNGASSSARRNSDDWTLINRESPTRQVVAMEVDENRGARPKTIYPELPNDVPSAPSAPPKADAVLLDSERKRIQEAIESIRSMGFNFETSVLGELLRRENCDIASVLEMILSNATTANKK